MRFILILIILIPLNAYTQSATSYKCDCKKIEYLKTVTSSDTIQDERYLACCHHCLGIEYYYDNEYLKAINHFEKAIDIRLKNNYDGLAKSYRNSGYCHKELGLYNKTISLINEAIQRSDKEKNRLANYVHLGSCYTSIGEFEKAENSLSTAFQLAESYENRAKVNNTSCILYTINESFKAIEYGEKATLLYEKAYTGGTKSVDSTRIFRDRATAYNNLGNAYRKVGKNEKAIKSYNFSIQSYQEINNVFLEAQTLNNVAAALYGQKKYKEAIKVSNESLQLKKKYYSNDLFNYTYAANHENLAENYEALDSIDKALYHYQYALINLTNNNFEEEDIQQSPNPSDSNLYVYNKIDLIRVLHLKASAAFKKYQKESDKTYLNLAEKTYNTAFQFHNQLPQQITTQESRLFQAKVILPFIENALAVAYELQEKQQQTPETAYRFMGKNKATVLLQSINEAKALEYAGLPKSLLNQEKELRETITAYEKQLNDARQYEEKEATKQYENLLSEQKNTYDQLIQNLENKHPEYYNLKYKQNTTTLKHAQNYLDNETALLEYFVGDSSVYVLAIEKNKARLHRLDKPENWNKTLNDFRKSVVDKKYRDSIDFFANNVHQLYKWLLPESFKKPNFNIKRLQIIPDAQLNYLPFGLLIDNIPTNPNYQNLPYLLKEKSISYAYSAALLLEEKKQQNTTQYLYGGFAPKYDGIKHDNLPDGYENVKQQAKKFKCEPFLADQATIQQFRDSADQFQILHLSMHGILDDENPLYSKLIFANNEPLHAADLYNTRLNADLAILSACNTGTGEIKKGEGVMSLSRAFTYAGCPSLLMSLWQVPDGSTAEIMNSFLEQLQQGKTKDEALQAAQLAYLAEASTTQHPSNWAGFIPSGDMQTVQFGRTWNWWWAILLLLCVILYFGKRVIR